MTTGLSGDYLAALTTGIETTNPPAHPSAKFGTGADGPFKSVLASQLQLQTAAASPQTQPSAAVAVPAVASQYQTFVSYEMNMVGGSVRLRGVTGDGLESLAAGQQWQIEIKGATPNTELRLLTDGHQPRQFQTVGKTDAQGNLTLTVTATADQVGAHPYLPYFMRFPNSVGGGWDQPGLQDPGAPAGYHDACLAIVSYDVGAGAPGTQTVTGLASPAPSGAANLSGQTASSVSVRPTHLFLR